MRKSYGLAVSCLLALVLAAPAYGLSLNKSIKIEAGTETGGQSSVNGSIKVGEGAVIDGSLETVNGSIRVDENVTLDDAETVNGTIRSGSGKTSASAVTLRPLTARFRWMPEPG